MFERGVGVCSGLLLGSSCGKDGRREKRDGDEVEDKRRRCYAVEEEKVWLREEARAT